MFKLKRKTLKRSDSLQRGFKRGRRNIGRKALKIAAGIGAGAGTVFLAFMMTWLISL